MTDHAEAAAAMRQLRDWGQAGRYNHVLHGFNYRMDGIQGAILEVKLRRTCRHGPRPATRRTDL